MIAEANRCYIGGWEQMQKDLERDDSFEDDEISDAQWKEWTYNDMKGIDVREGRPLSWGKMVISRNLLLYICFF